MTQRYDHPNVIVRRENAKTSLASATAILRFNFFQKCRVKAVHLYPAVAGTSTAFTQTVKSIIGTTTTSVGVSTLGTGAAGVKTAAATISIGTGNTPAGITFDANESLTITNATDATGIYNAVVEYEVLPDAART